MRSELVSSVLAHAFGERYDSPVPLGLFVLGGAVVVLLSFLVVYRQTVPAAGPDAPTDDITVAPRAGPVAAAASIVVFLLLLVTGFAGTQEVSENLLPIVFWLVVWVAVPLLTGVVGDFTGPGNPFAALARLSDRPGLRRMLLGTERPLPWSPRVGWWPAVLLFYVVVAGELIVNRQATLPRVTAAGLAVYALVCLTGGLVVGANAWCTRRELFTLLFATWGRLGFYRFRAPGRRGFGGGLDVPFSAHVSRVVFVLLLLVAVSFDGVISTPQWASFLDTLGTSVTPGTKTNLTAAAALGVLTLLMLALFGAFASAAARAGGHGVGRLEALAGLLPSLLPIAFGYQLAHYLQYIAINGQLLLPLAGDPLGLGWSWAPYPFSDSYQVDTAVMPTGAVWYVQTVVIVLAHVAAVVLAHRYLARRAPDERRALRSEWPWLVAMVGYTMLSLWLLAQPIIEHAESGHGG